MSALEQNSPPKPESDCGVTRMCVNPVAPAHHDQAPLWAVELIIFTVAVVVAVLAYRLMLIRRPH